LIHENDVSRALDSAEGAANLTGELRGALPGSAGEKDERVVGDRANRGQHDDPQGDLTAGFGGPVFENGQGSAVGVSGTIGARAGMKTVEGAGSGTTSAGRGGPEHLDEQEASKKTRATRSGPRRTVQVRG
jgi:hypothetical protein